MKRLIWLTIAAVSIWILWSSWGSMVIHPIRGYDVIDSIKIQVPRDHK